MQGGSKTFAGQSLCIDWSSMAGSRKVTTMAAKGERKHI